MEAAITNPAGAAGYGSELQQQLWSSQVELISTAAITAPAVVSLGTTGQVTTALTNGTVATNIGIAIQSASTTGRSTRVVVGGLAENVPCAGAVAAGDILKASVTTAGRVSATAAPAAGEAVGIAINASSSNTVDVWVIKSL